MSEIELKPCPFCGGKPFFQHNGPLGRKGWYEVVCDNVCDFVGPCDEVKEEAFRKWNTRTSLTPTPARDGVEPAGWKLVPVEPTEAMIDAARMARMNVQGGYGGPGPWEAMIAAAPSPPTTPDTALREHEPNTGLPIEPTEAMLDAGQEEIAMRSAHGMGVYAADIYEAMAQAHLSQAKESGK